MIDSERCCHGTTDAFALDATDYTGQPKLCFQTVFHVQQTAVTLLLSVPQGVVTTGTCTVQAEMISASSTAANCQRCTQACIYCYT